jgi:phage recombination protein Bet
LAGDGVSEFSKTEALKNQMSNTPSTVRSATAQTQSKAATPSEPSDFERLISQPSKPMDFVPFGGSDPIRLTVGIVQKLIAKRTKSGETCSQEDAMRFMMMCQARRLNPFEGDAWLIGYDAKDGPVFTLETAHQAFLKRGELHPEYQGMESGVVVLIDGVPADRESDFHTHDEKIVGGWAKVFRKDRTIPTYRRLRLAAFAQNYGRWATDAAGMICKCAEADALRSAFPTLVGGLYLEGEIKIDLTPAQLAGANFAPHRSDKSKLVEVVPAATRDETAEAEAGLAPAAEAKETSKPKPDEKTPQVQLMELVTSAGFTFSHLQAWGTETGNLPDGDSCAGFREIKTDVAVRLLRAQKGLLAGLAQAKGVAA